MIVWDLGFDIQFLFQEHFSAACSKSGRSSSSLLLSSVDLSETQKSMSLKYEPASELLHMSVV